jgi:small GTP-binding protein
MSAGVCKLVFLGEHGVGKTAVIHRLTDDEFRHNLKATIGVEFSTIKWDFGGTAVDFQIWDTAGSERFHAVGCGYLRGTDACIIVFDLTQRPSFQKVEYWHNVLLDAIQKNKSAPFPIMVFGNKIDLENDREVPREEAERFTRENGFGYIEVSAKLGTNVREGFDEISKRFLQNVANEVRALPSVAPPTDKGPRDRSCC